MANSKAKKRTSTRKKVVAKKGAARKSTTTKRLVKNSVAKKSAVKQRTSAKRVVKKAAKKRVAKKINTKSPSAISNNSPALTREDLFAVLNLYNPPVPPAQAPENTFSRWGKKSAPTVATLPAAPTLPAVPAVPEVPTAVEVIKVKSDTSSANSNAALIRPDLSSTLNSQTPPVAPAAKSRFKRRGKESAPVAPASTTATTASTATDAKSAAANVAKLTEAKDSKVKSNSRKKATGNPELAEKIRSWGKKRRLSKDGYLIGLADALENDEDLVVWASTDVLAVFPHSYAAQTPNRIYSLLVLIRNVLVFVPVGLTWLAIGKATEAFAIYTTKETGTVANFLQFWEDGYGYLGEDWTLSHIAVLDFQLILAVIILTLITEIVSDRAEARAENDDLDSERERISLAVEVMAYLFDKRGVNNVTMNSALARSVQNLSASSKSLNEAAQRIEKVSKSLPNNAAIIQEIRKAGR